MTRLNSFVNWHLLKPPDVGSYFLNGLLNPEPGAEPPAAVVRLRAVVIKEDTAEAAIAKKGAAEFSHIRGCLHPTRRLRIELSQFLQFQISDPRIEGMLVGRS